MKTSNSYNHELVIDWLKRAARDARTGDLKIPPVQVPEPLGAGSERLWSLERQRVAAARARRRDEQAADYAHHPAVSSRTRARWLAERSLVVFKRLHWNSNPELPQDQNGKKETEDGPVLH